MPMAGTMAANPSGRMVMPTAPAYGWNDIARASQQAEMLRQRNQYGRQILDPTQIKGPGGALAAIIGAIAMARNEKKASGLMADAMAQERGLTRYEKQIDELREQERQIAAEQRAERRRVAERKSDRTFQKATMHHQETLRKADRREAERRRQEEYDQRRADRLADLEAGREHDFALREASDAQAQRRAELPSRQEISQARAKATDIQEALKLLDEAQTYMNERKSWFADTGPIDQYMPTKYKARLDAYKNQIFAVMKRIYKAPGEGQFSDADAKAVFGASFDTGKFSDVNNEIMDTMRSTLQERATGYGELLRGADAASESSAWADDLSPAAQEILRKAGAL